MGMDVPFPHGLGVRTLLGHRLLCLLHGGPKNMRMLHTATGNIVPAVQMRAALEELAQVKLVSCERRSSGPRGGRPAEVWVLRHRGSVAIPEALLAVAAAKSTAGRQRDPSLPRPSISRAPVRQRAMRRRKQVSPLFADAICRWLAAGRYLRDFCDQLGYFSTRTVYDWLAKDPVFRRQFHRARLLGAAMLAEQHRELMDSPQVLALYGSTRESRRAFRKTYIRPFEVKMARWGNGLRW